MDVHPEEPGRSVQAELIATLGWELVGGYGGQVHPGDLGWYQRFDDHTIAGGLCSCGTPTTGPSWPRDRNMGRRS